MRLFLLAAALLVCGCGGAASLPRRRLGFVASTNGGAASFQPLADLFLAHAASWNAAHAYCSSPGEVTNATELPQPPFCWANWTAPIRAAAPRVLQLPIIQLLGDSGPLNFRHPYIFAAKYVAWAVRNDFDGYLLDAEFKGDDAAFAAFLDVFADALHAANKSLGVFLYPDNGKAPVVNATRADYWLGTWAGKCATIPAFIYGENRYWGRGGLMLYQSDAACSGAGVAATFAAFNESRMEAMGFWANGAAMGASWYDAMAAFLAESSSPSPSPVPSPSPAPPASAAPPPMPWAYTGFDRFPAFYFGANEAGPQSRPQVAEVARYSLAGWGWQQGYAGSGGKHGEANGAAAAAALRAAAPAGAPGAPDATFVYRQSESLFTYYDLSAAVAANASLLAAAELHDPVSGAACGGGGLLAFGAPAFAAYWADVVGGEVVAEPAVSAVFYDGFDKLYAGSALASQGCPAFTESRTAAALTDKLAATAAQARVLNAGGRVPIISSYNYLAAAAAAPALLGAMSGVTEDAYIAALAGTAWMRFQEVWLGHGPEQDAAQVANAILEVAAGVPFVARSATPKKGSLAYYAAGFLIAQGPHCYWGASQGWLDADWAWHGEYDWVVGTPLAPAERTGAFSWRRAFARANVTLDVHAGTAEVVWGDGAVVRGARGGGDEGVW